MGRKRASHAEAPKHGHPGAARRRAARPPAFVRTPALAALGLLLRHQFDLTPANFRRSKLRKARWCRIGHLTKTRRVESAKYVQQQGLRRRRMVAVPHARPREPPEVKLRGGRWSVASSRIPAAHRQASSGVQHLQPALPARRRWRRCRCSGVRRRRKMARSTPDPGGQPRGRFGIADPRARSRSLLRSWLLAGPSPRRRSGVRRAPGGAESHRAGGGESRLGPCR